MKNIFQKAGTAMMVAFLIACSGGNSPKGVAENFLKAMNRLDFEGAKKYGTEDTGKMLDMLNGFMKMGPDSVKNKDVKLEMVSEKISGDTSATVTYKEEGKEGDQFLELVKVDGNWKVAMSKDNMNGGSGSIESGATNTESDGSASADSTAK